MAIAIKSLIFPINCNNKNLGERKNKPPIFLSTNPSHVNIDKLSILYRKCSHSPHRFPSSDEIVAGKLAVAVDHSSVVVSVFAAFPGTGDDLEEREKGFWGRIIPASVTPENGDLVGFGRAVSDLGLTASIYDVMVRLTSFFSSLLLTSDYFFRTCYLSFTVSQF